MKLATLLLWAVAGFAGRADYGTPPRFDDWRNPPEHHAPTWRGWSANNKWKS